MIFQFTHELVMSGAKVQTRRIAKPGEELVGAFADDPEVPPRVETLKGSTKWRVGSTYAVQPGRGKKAVGRIRITRIRREDVRRISGADVAAEGFGHKADFLLTWCRMNDKEAATAHPDGTWLVRPADEQINQWLQWLLTRPAERYQAWVLCFELVPG